MQHVAIGCYLSSLSLPTNYTLSGFAPFKNGYSEYPFLELTIYHIETHYPAALSSEQTVYLRISTV